MKKTFRELQEIDEIVGMLYKKEPALRNTKFGYAYKRFTEKNYEPMVKDYKEEIAHIRIEHALEDAKTKEVILRQESGRGFAYSKQGLKDVIKAEGRFDEEFMAREKEIAPLKADITPIIEMLDEDAKEIMLSIIDVK